MIYELIILLIGWLYPAFATYTSLSANQHSQLSWLKYWIVFALFTAFHFLTVCLESLVPFFAGFKLCILFWLLPNLGGGSQLIHDGFVDPLMTSNRIAINRAFNTVSDMTSALLRELIKMIYHLLVDVVEQCWQLTRNADDIHVTPRLQAAINDVIAELRAAQQAAYINDSAAACLPPYIGAFETLEAPELLDNIDECKPNTLANTDIGCKTCGGRVAISSDTIGAATATGLALPNCVTPSVSQPDNKMKSDDDIQLRILLAEAASAMRMQQSLESANCEHLAPINRYVRPQKPKRGKRNKGSKEPSELPLEQSEMDDVDRAYSEYRARE